MKRQKPVRQDLVRNYILLLDKFVGLGAVAAPVCQL